MHKGIDSYGVPLKNPQSNELSVTKTFFQKYKNALETFAAVSTAFWSSAGEIYQTALYKHSTAGTFVQRLSLSEGLSSKS